MQALVFQLAFILASLFAEPAWAGNVETTIKNIHHKLTGDIAIIIGAIFIVIAGYRMFTSKAAGSSVVICIVAAIVIIKSEDIIRWVTGAL